MFAAINPCCATGIGSEPSVPTLLCPVGPAVVQYSELSLYGSYGFGAPSCVGSTGGEGFVPDRSRQLATGSCHPCRIARSRIQKQRNAPTIATAEDGSCSMRPRTT